MKLTIPDNNDPQLHEAVKRLLTIQSPHIITEIYGKPTKSKAIGSGRANVQFNDIDRAQTIERVLQFQRLGLEYDYAINGVIPRDPEPIIEELQWLEESPIRTITVANYQLAVLAQEHASNLEITVSFFAGVDNEHKLAQWAELSNVKAVNTDRSTYRNLPLLKKLVETGKQHDTGIRVIANLGCMSDCIRTEEHALVKDFASIDRDALHYAPCTFYCMRYLLEHPEKFLSLPIIRPEDLHKYDEVGVESVKLVDRVQTTAWIENIVTQYLTGSYKGNILELTCNFTRSGADPLTNDQVAAIDMDEVMQTREGVMAYREILPELMGVSIKLAYNLLACNNVCNSCRDGCDTNAIDYDPERRDIVLAQLDRLEREYLFT